MAIKASLSLQFPQDWKDWTDVEFVSGIRGRAEVDVRGEQPAYTHQHICVRCRGGGMYSDSDGPSPVTPQETANLSPELLQPSPGHLLNERVCLTLFLVI